MAREATARLREELEAGEFVSGYGDESDSGSGSSEGEAGEAPRKRVRSPGSNVARNQRRRGEGRRGE
jgi:hypothetical protein